MSKFAIEDDVFTDIEVAVGEYVYLKQISAEGDDGSQIIMSRVTAQRLSDGLTAALCAQHQGKTHD